MKTSPLKIIDEVLIMPRPLWLLLVACVGALSTAYTAQYVFGLQPCNLCLWQRIPFWLSIAFLLFALIKKDNVKIVIAMLALTAIAMFSDAGLAFFHSGVELHWWKNPFGCAVTTGDSTDVEALQQQLLETEAVSCDKITWAFLGFSMANWSVPFALGLLAYAALTIFVIKTKKKFG